VVSAVREKRRRRWLQFSLRTFLLLTTVLGVWLGLYIRSARRQQAAVEAIRAQGGVRYDYQDPSLGGDWRKGSNVPAWLLDGLGEDYFHNVTSLLLQDSPLDIFAHLDAMPRLRFLQIVDTIDRTRAFHSQIYPSEKDLRVLARLNSFERIQLQSFEGITDEGIEQLAQSRNLRIIFILNARLTDQSLTALTRLKRLEELGLTGDFTDNGLASLQKHARLKSLFLGSPSITDAGLIQIARLSSLQYLELHGCRVTNDGMNHLAGLRKLRSLDVYGTAVDDVSALQKALPSCIITLHPDLGEWYLALSASR
jgi:hypothetical protein